MTNNKRHFVVIRIKMPIQEFFCRNFYRCGIGKLYEFCRQLEKCSTNSYETFSTTGCDDVSPIDLVLLRITFQIREF